jgi:hypothetical protein
MSKAISGFSRSELTSKELFGLQDKKRSSRYSNQIGTMSKPLFVMNDTRNGMRDFSKNASISAPDQLP